MSEFSDKAIQKQDVKQFERSRKDKLAGYVYDISKLTYGGVGIGALLAWIGNSFQLQYLIASIIGLYVALGLAWLANRILKP